VALAAAGNISKVNGGIEVETGEEAGDVSTVNGGIVIGQGARVREIETVNGRMSLDEATVGGGLETVNGDITVGANSRVEGGILVDKPSGTWSIRKQRNPKVTIEAGAVVNGTLRFEREVDLYVSPSATIGSVEGVPPIRHTLQ
jgi:DUF4097 and DUF4098 domain-containing protein YvlB